MKVSPEARMVANAKAWLEEMGFPDLAILDDPEPKSDHCFLAYSKQARDYADLIMIPWRFATNWKDHQPRGYPTCQGGWREFAKAAKFQKPGETEELQYRWGAQLNYHQDPIRGDEFFELDFDSWNPCTGHGVALLHAFMDWFGQKFRGSKTSPYTVAKRRGWDEENV